MSNNIGNFIIEFTQYVKDKSFDMIVVHGDRVEALGGAIVAALNNIRLAHIEGGELSGTIDDAMRHATSKLSQFHFVSNNEAKQRLINMGENKERIFVIGSPDIDIMLSKSLPSIKEAKKRYDIPFNEYGILLFHPVTTEEDRIEAYAKMVIKAVVASKKNYVVVYPNNDIGSEKIIKAYSIFKNNSHFRVFPSLRFEYFLSLLKNAKFIVGNSSAGVREASIYGVPSIDIGTRQSDRYHQKERKDIIHVDYHEKAILNAINHIKPIKCKHLYFGHGHSSENFYQIISKDNFWKIKLQKKFIDVE